MCEPVRSLLAERGAGGGPEAREIFIRCCPSLSVWDLLIGSRTGTDPLLDHVRLGSSQGCAQDVGGEGDLPGAGAAGAEEVGYGGVVEVGGRGPAEAADQVGE